MARQGGSGPARLVAAGRQLAAEQQLVVAAAAVLLATMLLPWYSRTVNAVVGGKLVQQAESKLAITVFSFVEAAIFLVAVGVIALIWARGQRRAFHLPGGDGTIVAAAGAWATFLIFYRFVDKPGGDSGPQVQVEYGLSWGIFFGLLAALALVAAGLRLRAAQVAEPALPGQVAPSDGPSGAPAAQPRHRASPAAGGPAVRPRSQVERPAPAEPSTAVAHPSTTPHPTTADPASAPTRVHDVAPAASNVEPRAHDDWSAATEVAPRARTPAPTATELTSRPPAGGPDDPDTASREARRREREQRRNRIRPSADTPVRERLDPPPGPTPGG